MIDSGRDLLEVLKVINTTNEDIVLDARYLLDQLEKDTDFYIEFGERIDEFCQEELICPSCGRDLTPIEEDYTYIVHRCLNNECSHQ